MHRRLTNRFIILILTIPEIMKKTILLSILLLTFLFSKSCKKEESPNLPVLSTNPVTDITAISAVSGGKITDDGGAPITKRGICWGTANEPTTSDSKTSSGTGTGEFISNIDGLNTGTSYHLRAYAINAAGTSYGEDVSFSTLGEAPAAITMPALYLSTTSATLYGNVNANYSSATVTFEYGTTTGYGSVATVAQSPVTGNSGTEVNAKINSLSPGTNYHYRVKAVNSLGTTYGEDMTFTSTEMVGDVDGNEYNTVLIGTQLWMAENLKTTKYNDGTQINGVTNGDTWFSLTTGAYCDYNNYQSQSDTYGRLYNWYTVAVTNPKNVCPADWHIPSDEEWTSLTTYTGGESLSGDKLKETGTIHWIGPNAGASNETGFTALPGGYRTQFGTFDNIGTHGYWWSSTETDVPDTWANNMSYDANSTSRSLFDKRFGFSVRCIRDN
jgi:uncharacterized protein (TIGR02145 family)